MKTILFLISALGFTFMSLAQTKSNFAEMQMISDLKRINGELKTILFQTNDGNHILLLDKHDAIILQKIGKSGIEIEKEYTITAGKEETFFLDAFAGSDQIYLLSGYLENKQMIVCKTSIDMGTLEINDKTTKLNNFPCKNEYYSSKDFEMKSSPDNKLHLLLFIDEMTNNDSASF